MDNTNTILLTESGDLEVYEGKRPEETTAVQDIECCGNPTKYGSCCGNGVPVWKEEQNPDFYQWLSTKKVVKMAEGELIKINAHFFENKTFEQVRNYPIDVSDIVTLRPVKNEDVFSSEGIIFLGYFTPPPVDKEEETQEGDIYHLFKKAQNMDYLDFLELVKSTYTLKRR